MKKQNPVIPLLLCLCGWLFGQGVYEMTKPILFNAVATNAVMQRVIHEFSQVHTLSSNVNDGHPVNHFTDGHHVSTMKTSLLIET
jgi:hypothetical protein